MMRALIVLLVLARAPFASAAPLTPAAQLYAQGESQFRAGEIEDAIESFSRGYALEPKPEFLLNLAQCYRALGRRAEAILHFERFIRAAPEHPLRGNAERTLIELRRAEALDRIANTPPAVVVHQAPPPAQPPRRDEPRSSRTWLWATAGAVLVIGGGTALFFTMRGDGGPDDTIRLPP